MPKAFVHPNEFSFSAAISSAEKGSQLHVALDLFEAMPKAFVQPSVVAYSATISACEKAGAVAGSIDAFLHYVGDKSPAEHSKFQCSNQRL